MWKKKRYENSGTLRGNTKIPTLLIINFGQFAVFQYVLVWFVQVRWTMALKVYILVVSGGVKQVLRT